MYVVNYYAKHCNRSGLSRLRFYLPPPPNSEKSRLDVLSCSHNAQAGTEKHQGPPTLRHKTPICSLKVPESCSDLCLQMVAWQMILVKDIQDTETHSGPVKETAVWEQLWGPFCVKFKLLPPTLAGGRRGKGLMLQRASIKGSLPRTAPSSLL